MYTNLKELISDSKEYENISERRSSDFEELEKALGIVEKFIKDKGLILYGGMSIDFALKAANKPGIYTDSTIPDYDFISYSAYEHSIELADILQKANMTNISSINAMHVTSRRVRINYVPVADITYVPKTIFDKIPTISYKGLKVIHPNFQRLDMHRAFSTPYEHVPQELVYFRGSKDMARFKLIDDAYPIRLDDTKKFKLSNKISIKLDSFQDAVIGGTAGYALMYAAVADIVKHNKLKYDMSKLFDPELEIVNNKGTELKFKSYESRCCIISDNFIERSNTYSGKKKYYNKFMDDIIPRSIEVQDSTLIELYDNKGRLLPSIVLTEFLKTTRKYAPHFEKQISNHDNINIAMIQNILMHFLAKYFLYNDKSWLWLYWSGCELVKIAESVYLDNFNEPEFLKLPLFLTAYTYGKWNWDYSYIYMYHRYQAQIYDSRDKMLELASARPPHGYYPDRGTEPPKFDAQASWLFQIDGLEQKTPFKPLYLIASDDKIEGGGSRFKHKHRIRDLTQMVRRSFDPIGKTAVSLFNEVITKTHDPIIKKEQIKHQIPYSPDFKPVRLGVHFGQRKLLLSEIQFLSKYTGEYVIYVGAAPGNKTQFLSDLFPDRKFILVDPVRFNLILSDGSGHRTREDNKIVHLSARYPTESLYYNFKSGEYEKWTPDKPKLSEVDGDKLVSWIKKSDHKIFIIEDLFTEKLSIDFSKIEDSLFISDIRSFFTVSEGDIVVKGMTSKKLQGDNEQFITDITILWDMCLQYLWIMTMKPTQSVIKFRGMYYDDRSANQYSEYMRKAKNTEYMRPAFEQAKKLGMDFLKDYNEKKITYFNGIEYMQAWAPTKSGEVRLHISRKDVLDAVKGKYHVYDSKEHDDKIFYFNTIYRPYAFCNNPASDPASGFDHCQDCALEYEIWKEYLGDQDDIIKKIKSKVDDVNNLLKRKLFIYGHGKFFTKIKDLS